MHWTRRDLGRLAIGAGGIGLVPRRWARGAQTITAHGVSAFGDLKYPPDFAHFDYAAPDAPVGGPFSMAVGGVTFDSLNPFVIKGNPAFLIPQLTFDSLMAGSDDEADAVYGLIAERIEYPEDRTWAAFELRPEARFADGTQITAEDVVFTLDILRKKGHPQYNVVFASVAEAVAESARRVRFDLVEGAPKRDLPMLVAGLSIVPKAYFAERDFGDSTLEPLLGSGPYEIIEIEPGRTVTFRRRDDYWGWDLPLNRGRWNFGEIRVEYFRDRSVEFEGFKAGAFTFKEEFWSKLWATGYDFPAVERGDVVRETLPDNRPSGSQGFWFNLRREKLQDRRVREAIALGFDFEWSNRTLFFDLYTRTDSFFEGGPMQAEGPPTPAELRLLEPLAQHLPPGVLEGPAYVPPKTDGSGRNRHNLRKAARLLEDAGWHIEGRRRVNAAGEALVLDFLIDSPSFERIVVPYAKNLRKIGIEANHRVVDAAQYKKREDEFDFDLIVDRKSMSLTPGVELRNYFHSSSADAKGSQNTAGVANPAVDALIDHVERARSREELTATVKALDRVLRAMHIWVPQWHKSVHTLAYWDIYGRPPEPPRYARGVIDLWWVDPDKYARLKDKIGG